jgi:BNR/Asp-box repeat
MNQCIAFAGLVVLALGTYASSARGHGRFPASNELVINPADPNHLVVRTTFGFVESTDAGRSFRWICDEMVSKKDVHDPPLALTGDGSLVVAVPFEGVAVSHDHGCSWALAPAPLAEQFVVDMTPDPRATSSLLVLTSTADSSTPPESDTKFISLLLETRDDARSWAVFGTPLPTDFIATAFDVAPSDPDRIYVSGVVDVGAVVDGPPSAAVERSDDRGATWKRHPLPLSEWPVDVVLSAIHPRDPDRLWVRALFAADADGSSPTSLYRSDDGGATWSEVAATADTMLGLALSPDGEALAYGSLAGVFSGPATGNQFTPLAAISNRCLTWSPSGLYACATEPTDPFGVGLSRASGGEFDPLYRIAATCPQECPDTSSFALTCRQPWTTPQGVAELTGAQGESCSVAWARPSSRGQGGSPAAASGGQAQGPAGRVNAGGACALAYAGSNQAFSICCALGLLSLSIRRRARARR